jgi:vanillate O-demethylase ferredoxin subunit
MRVSQPTYERVDVIVRSKILLATDTVAVELVARDGSDLPTFDAGAHIDVLLPANIRRPYSLCNKPTDRGRYVIAVKKARPSQGASTYIHDRLQVGDEVKIFPPRNNFPLSASADESIFIAGGIGITPIWSMIQVLEESRRPWKLYYAVRKRGDAAFLEELQALDAADLERIDIRFDEEPGVAMLDIGAIVANNARHGTHFYACGPVQMLDAFELATKTLPKERRHLERFTAPSRPLPSEGARSSYEVVLAKTGLQLDVCSDKSLLDTLLDAGVEIEYSCTEGFCGSCKIKVIQGLPDHRDSVLTEAERARGDTILACCSGSLTERLVLDL